MHTKWQRPHIYMCVVFMFRHPSYSWRPPSTSIFLITFITCAWQEHFGLALTTSIALWKINAEMGLSQSRRVKGCWWWWWWWQGVWAKWSFERKCGEEKQTRGKTRRCLGRKWMKWRRGETKDMSRLLLPVQTRDTKQYCLIQKEISTDKRNTEESYITFPGKWSLKCPWRGVLTRSAAESGTCTVL